MLKTLTKETWICFGRMKKTTQGCSYEMRKENGMGGCNYLEHVVLASVDLSVDDDKHVLRIAIRACYFTLGSSDGKNWTNLKVHENDQTVTKPGQFASLAVTGPNALFHFRYFRVA
ncbi:BTB/POZ domain-containing protein [Artemisia annua]|uniref:BTB/POZ domain-containing protein n=1 Tax=Artemisia annua TaxID=35608 RepID=A0A2U1Q5Z4_ARTAN|nr:BTB/POZ domain-containing protein [Artemisia annua]